MSHGSSGPVFEQVQLERCKKCIKKENAL